MSAPVVVGTPVNEPRTTVYYQDPPRTTVYYQEPRYSQPSTIRVYSNRRPCYEDRYYVERIEYTDPDPWGEVTLLICLYCWCFLVIIIFFASMRYT
jgi:hypothetical protein